ncbi:hypothetical protein NQ317_000108 [Molorchus minor]|uniref:Uncharacterized protein n=1 Tax=Molorchus minor TaxID=1323400 RepID=A0ABQ9JKZ7_9CUCU|nr:hypothetical protein NQ317_000108 [Molorchus minor]
MDRRNSRQRSSLLYVNYVVVVVVRKFGDGCAWQVGHMWALFTSPTVPSPNGFSYSLIEPLFPLNEGHNLAPIEGD